MPDFKYFKKEYALKYSKTPQYLEQVQPGIAEMLRQVGEPVFNWIIKRQ